MLEDNFINMCAQSAGMVWGQEVPPVKIIPPRSCSGLNQAEFCPTESVYSQNLASCIACVTTAG